jgi:hypothetical protein
MKRYALLVAILLAQPLPSSGQSVEKVRTGTPGSPGLPEDLFELTPNTWTFGRQLWKGSDPCTSDQCEAGYTSGDLVVSVERSKRYLRIVAGFRDCQAVAWNEYEVGDKASKGESKTIGRRLKKTVGTSAKYCKVTAPVVAGLDATRLYPAAVATP